MPAAKPAHAEEPIVKQAPAIGYSIVANLKGERQMTVQCFVGEDEDDAVVNARIDRILRVVDRQRARCELEELREDLDKAEAGLRRFDEDLARIEAEHQKKLAGYDVELLQIAEDREANRQQAEMEFRANRKGAFKLGGHALSRDSAYEASKQAVIQAKSTAVAEREAAIDQVQVNHGRFVENIERMRKDIAKREALLTG